MERRTQMSVNEWVADARSRVEELSNEQLETERTAGEALVVDVRDVRERWREGSIPGARSVPRGMLEFWSDPESEYYKDFMDPQRRTVVYCAAGQRSALAADALQRLGYTDVAHLEGGFSGWKAAGMAVEDVPRK
jgi:rhodanese-related sulfurtransferase